MKPIYSISILFLLFSCTDEKTASYTSLDKETESEIVVPEFQSIIDSADVKGSILIYDLKKNKYYSNNFNWANKGQLPASTFKIPNSIIAIETGVVENDSTVFYWNGEKRGNKNWEQNLTFNDALHYSCVPCYQEVAKNIGVKRMRKYLDLFNYGSIKVGSTNIDMFWLEGESRISQFQQIDFLTEFYQSNLSISKRTEKIIKRMMIVEENDKFKVSGKTGWSYSNGKDNGWFVGYIETKKAVYFFATNIEPSEQLDINLFSEIRTSVTYKAFEHIKVIE